MGVEGGFCFAGGFADAENGLMYGASNWDDLFKEDHEVEELQDDGETTKKVMINEAANIKIAMDTGKKPPGELWVGGVKYKIINKNTFEVGDGEECPGLLAQERRGASSCFLEMDQLLWGSATRTRARTLEIA